MINEYFKYSEFDCKCGKCERPKGVPSNELIEILTTMNVVDITIVAKGIYMPEEKKKED